MAITITQTPTYAVFGREMTLTFSASGGGNFVRVWVTDAPDDSEQKRKLLEQNASRRELFSGDVSDVFRFTPDKGGRYVLAVQEYTKGATGYGGGYKGDPAGYSTETKVGSETTDYLTIGQKFTMPIGVSPDSGTLELWLWDDTIRETSVEEHGEDTPRITNTTSPRAKTAAKNTNVQSALDDLVDTTASTAVGDLQAVLEDFIDEYTAHRAGSPHASGDGTNTIPDTWKYPDTPQGFVEAVAYVHAALGRHVRSDQNGVGADEYGTGTGEWHQIGGVNAADFVNTLVTKAPGDMAGVVAALADIWRVYEGHRVSDGSTGIDAGVHDGGADTTNTLAALPKLLEVHRYFLGVLASKAPTAASVDNSGAAVLVHGAGMNEV